MKWKNCLTEALKLWKKNGYTGYLKIRLARTIKFPFPHFLYESMDGNIIQYHPKNPKNIPEPFFDGEYIYGDYAWKCHQLLKEHGYCESQLIKMSDLEVIAEYERLKDEIQIGR